MSGGIESPGGSSYANSGLNRFGGIPAYTPDPYKPQTFSPQALPPMRAFPGTSGGGISGGPGPGMGGEGGSIGPPDPSTNPAMSNSITTGLVGLMLGPVAASAVNGLLGGGDNSGTTGGVSSAAATIGDSGVPSGAVAGEGLGAIGPSDGGDGGGGGGGGGK